MEDWGHWERVSNEGMVTTFYGLSTEVGKLPIYNELATGSTALCLDTGDLYIYHKGLNKWYLQG